MNVATGERFEGLPPYQPRKFVPHDAKLVDRDAVAALYRKVLAREISSKEEFESWLFDISELNDAFGQVSTVLYIEMTCQTDDAAKAKAYQDLIERVEPALKPICDQINRKYWDLRQKFDLDSKRYEIYDRAVRAAIEMFVEKNIPLQTETALLAQEYQAVSGAMTVQFDGKERTLPEMSKFLLETDRSLRERAWRATAHRRLKDKERLEGIFEKLLGLRHQVARNANFCNFRDYQFKAYLRFDYAPDDCRAYHRSIKECVNPLKRAVDLRRARDMKLATLRPWDVMVDPLNRQPLKPFSDVDDLVGGVERIVRSLDGELGDFFVDMRVRGLLDLASRKGKAPGGYQSALSEARKPFIFMNSVGIDDDVRTLLHESGHAFHTYLSAADPLDSYRHAPMEFCEVASMSMEFMGNEHLSVFYDKDDARRSVVEFLEGVISVLGWVATIDSFQHWIYENPTHSREERRGMWLKLHEDFGGGVTDWSGLDEERACLWHRQLHIYEVPFYYIEYGIAQLGALQIWWQFRKSPQQAIANYKKALALGGSRPLPELFAAAGIRFDFSKEMIAPLMDDVFAEWKRWNQ